MSDGITFYIKHLAMNHRLNAWLSFSLDRSRTIVRNFQADLRNQRGKIKLAARLTQKYGLFDRIKLNNQTLDVAFRDLGNILAKIKIYPTFFADALHTIGAQAQELAPIVERINLSKLSKANIAAALRSGKITHQDVGKKIPKFQTNSPQEKIALMIKLGVIVLRKGATWKKPEENRPQRRPSSLALAFPRRSFRTKSPRKASPTRPAQLVFNF